MFKFQFWNKERRVLDNIYEGYSICPFISDIYNSIVNLYHNYQNVEQFWSKTWKQKAVDYYDICTSKLKCKKEQG